MDFFEHQHVARKRTGRLVILFVLAVLGIIAVVYVALAAILAAAADNDVAFTDPALFLGVAGSVTAVVVFASLYKLAQLRGGGRVVAESLGGRLIEPGSADPTERKILNVVEEMAIASGLPVPPVYLLDDEQAINAFAAGYSPSDAVVGVTRGCVELLSRDELQGVMAHEFSHILNGDMRLNIRLIGVVFGILALGMVGGVILRSVGRGRVRARGKNAGQGILIMLAIGLTLWILGSLGVLFGNLIKAAVSRQREFLADASAVQFTRNPDGIAGALRKIGGLSSGARLAHPRAEEASHMYFGEGVGHWLGGLMATHPPLDQRIRRVDPGWDGRFPHVTPTQRTQERREKLARMQEDRSELAKRMAAARAAGFADAAATAAGPLIEHVGNPTPAHVEHARNLLAAMDPAILAAAREAYGARALVYALLLDHRNAQVRDRQLEALQRGDVEAARQLRALAPAVERMDESARLPAIDLALPALRGLSLGQYRAFIAQVDALIEADERVDVFEWVLRRLVVKHLATQHEPVQQPVVQYYNLRGVKASCAVLLSVLAYAGHREHGPAAEAFGAGAAAMGLADLSPVKPEQASLTALGLALDQLREVSPRAKRNVVAGAAACVASDRAATASEVELLRAVCETLDVPVPPWLPGTRVA